MVTMPSARFLDAVVGQTSTHGGSSQCWQPTGTKARRTSGYSPNSMSSTRRHWTPGGVAFAWRHAAVHVWQPTQRRRSATIAQRVMARLPLPGEPLTRTMSAPDPVASVSSIDIADSEFMLGMPKSLVNGVAQ